MKTPQWITIAVGIVLVVVLYIFGRTVPVKKGAPTSQVTDPESSFPTDSVLAQAKKKLSTAQLERLNALEHSVVRGDVKDQQLKVFHQLAHFWGDSIRLFEPYAWYQAEAARLENSEKSLTFAGQLFLQNLRGESNPSLRSWKAYQAKDLFERSLKINSKNDSSIVGIGACYIFGGIGETPMEGILQIRQVLDKDSTNLFALEVLGQGSMMSGQYDKAIARFETLYRQAKDNPNVKLEAALMLAEAYERKADKEAAVAWYKRSLSLVQNEQVQGEIKKRIDDLSKEILTEKNKAQ